MGDAVLHAEEFTYMNYSAQGKSNAKGAERDSDGKMVRPHGNALGQRALYRTRE